MTFQEKIKEYPVTLPASHGPLLKSVQDWAFSNGLTMLTDDPATAVHAPVTLHPSPFPRSVFDESIEAQRGFNTLYSKISSFTNNNWLDKIIDKLAPSDPDFTGKLWKTHKLSLVDGKPIQPLTLGLFRSDYMIDQKDGNLTPKQVEFNTVSVSFGGLTSKVADLHRYLAATGAYGDDAKFDLDDIPRSNSISELANGLAQAHKAYVAQNGAQKSKTAVLAVVEKHEKNAIDQRHLEYQLWDNHGIVTHRVSMLEATKVTEIRDLDGVSRLYYNDAEVSVVYFREGYSPDHFPTQAHWDARLYLEKNRAIKCPSVYTQLAGAKKVQQILTDKSELLKFVSEKDIGPLVNTFVEILPLGEDSEGGKRAEQLARTEPERFVLKPQREGGGNNIYKQDIPGFLEKLPKNEWSAYILMELINPPVIQNHILRKGELFTGDTLSELGVFGTVLWNSENGEILHNDTTGWLLRTKLESSNEGGVAAGFGCIDGVYLVD
ncbi:hypothetical protein B0I72DRAFT_141399 [Yarrowia lipolytica]|uniref:Glutathione synthetase n=1 Tax=Yarrowia lipolytica TaxID=4952 RepID=A0A371BZZ0_YARLL|nr:hypothetical protein B0I71DRAFT_135695 [Yarrowia lipolytica]RDW30490.1 hypothetical protein B0I72DRAFT_141399 [Yarrowia lipolytica]RDW37169.1 hypothetical protein B0I73DRAFT_135953 [Yarrowia lipolytica]RDW43612.1 hypothetical protein B0I74DRAFT_141741 [Yarrowia lipolytica]RDW50463.1 hypothetical protein B0I75DRAFT_141482 [Yarrowia lipolytica]